MILTPFKLQNAQIHLPCFAVIWVWTPLWLPSVPSGPPFPSQLPSAHFHNDLLDVLCVLNLTWEFQSYFNYHGWSNALDVCARFMYMLRVITSVMSASFMTWDTTKFVFSNWSMLICFVPASPKKAMFWAWCFWICQEWSILIFQILEQN